MITLNQLTTNSAEFSKRQTMTTLSSGDSATLPGSFIDLTPLNFEKDWRNQYTKKNQKHLRITSPKKNKYQRQKEQIARQSLAVALEERLEPNIWWLLGNNFASLWQNSGGQQTPNVVSFSAIQQAKEGLRTSN